MLEPSDAEREVNRKEQEAYMSASNKFKKLSDDYKVIYKKNKSIRS